MLTELRRSHFADVKHHGLISTMDLLAKIQHEKEGVPMDVAKFNVRPTSRASSRAERIHVSGRARRAPGDGGQVRLYVDSYGVV